ncbi:MAG: type IV toxin-antitoxin system AbiEi family antitoxin domain-containing protein [Clostridiaceae bacterium]|jgi:hypothetical protein|nr:type IV toxin-antitoxin system AbiEi family antitoxin domain-containing protein [Clostridiaceae bacterium]
MTLTQSIIDFAFRQAGPFKRKELAEHLDEKNISYANSLQKLLTRLVASGKLKRVDWGMYSISDNIKPKFNIIPNNSSKKIFESLKNRYPLVEFCVWDISCIIPFMLHVPNMSMTIIDVERTLERPFFDALQELYPQSIVLPNPGKEEFYNYGFGKNSIVVHSLITEAPIQSLGGIIVPTAEKLLVDIALNPEFDFLRGSEIYTVYENILTAFDISKSQLWRYAGRRSCEPHIRNIIKQTNLKDND